MSKSPDDKLVEIERLRGVAILLVLLHHCYSLRTALPPVFQSTWSGVDLFFVISGFVVTRSFLKLMAERSDLGALGTFYRRRLFRIFPLSFAAALALYLLSRFFNRGGGLESYPYAFIYFRSILTLRANYTFAALPAHSHFQTFWSLAVEDHFYLILPLLFVGIKNPRNRILFFVYTILLVAIGMRWFISPHYVPPTGANWRYYHLLSHNRFDSLMAGVLLCYLTFLKIPTFPHPAAPGVGSQVLVWVGLILLAGIPGYFSISHRIAFGYVMLWLTSGYLVHLAALDRGYVLDIPFIKTALEYFGSRSFALYLMHTIADTVFAEMRYRGWLAPLASSHFIPTLFRLSLYAGVTVGLAEWAHRKIERPFIKLGRRTAAHAAQVPCLDPGSAGEFGGT